MSVGTFTATNTKPKSASADIYAHHAYDLHIEFDRPLVVTAIDGNDPNAKPPAKDMPTVQGGGAGGTSPTTEVNITFQSGHTVPEDGNVTISVSTNDDKAIKGKYRFTSIHDGHPVYIYKEWVDFQLGSDEKPKEPEK